MAIGRIIFALVYVKNFDNLLFLYQAIISYCNRYNLLYNTTYNLYSVSILLFIFTLNDIFLPYISVYLKEWWSVCLVLLHHILFFWVLFLPIFLTWIKKKTYFIETKFIYCYEYPKISLQDNFKIILYFNWFQYILNQMN